MAPVSIAEISIALLAPAVWFPGRALTGNQGSTRAAGLSIFRAETQEIGSMGLKYKGNGVVSGRAESAPS